MLVLRTKQVKDFTFIFWVFTLEKQPPSDEKKDMFLYLTKVLYFCLPLHWFQSKKLYTLRGSNSQTGGLLKFLDLGDCFCQQASFFNSFTLGIDLLP